MARKAQATNSPSDAFVTPGKGVARFYPDAVYVSRVLSLYSIEYRQGWHGYCRGLSVDKNPYSMDTTASNSRGQWFSGWYAAQIKERLGEVFNRWNILWPEEPPSEHLKKLLQRDDR